MKSILEKIVQYKKLEVESCKKKLPIKDLEKKIGLIYNTLIMDIEGGEVEVIKEIELNSFSKLIFEIHFDRFSKNYIIIKNELLKNNFKLQETYGKVEYWKR